MATDLGDVAAIGGSTLSGAAVGASVGGPVGAVIGGGIGLVSGLFANSAENKAEAAAEDALAREKLAVGIEGEAREMQILLNRLQADRERKSFNQRAFLASEATRAGAPVSGLVGSSIAASAQSSIQQQKGSNLQFSFLSQEIGEAISRLMQEAANARAGIGEEADVPDNLPAWVEAGNVPPWDSPTPPPGSKGDPLQQNLDFTLDLAIDNFTTDYVDPNADIYQLDFYGTDTAGSSYTY